MIHNSNKVIVSAPGKIHLSGEHAVVHGKPALLTAINLRLYATVEKDNKLTIITPEDPKLIHKAIEIVTKKINLAQSPKIKITITSQIPTGRHAGSSSALSVALVGALLYYYKKIWNPQVINELAYKVEKFQHGNPSGGDNTTATFGGLIWFRRELDFLKSMWQLPLPIPPSIATVLLIDTGRPQESTGEMVFQVAAFIKKNPRKAQQLLNKNEEATKQVTQALKENNEEKFIAAIRLSSQTLEGLEVVSAKAKILIKEIEKAGGAAKILGGGGKKDNVGLLLTYHKNKQTIKELAHKNNYKVYEVKLGEEGVRLESGKNI